MLKAKRMIELTGGGGDRIRVLPATGSTNDDLKALAKNGAPAGTVLVTDKQTAGKGRLGRSFFSPKSGVYLSKLYRPQGKIYDALQYTTAAAVAVCRAVEAVSSRKAEIKWVNDVYVDGRKVCGILTEGSVTGQGLEWAVVGIGTNITPPEGGFPAEIADRAGALFESGKAPDGISEEYAAALMTELDNCLSSEDENVRRAVMEEYRRRSFVIGREVTVVTAAGEYRCKAVGITDDAGLVTELPDGSRRVLHTGEVSIRV